MDAHGHRASTRAIVRAVLIAAVLAVHGLKAAPLPRPMRDGSFAKPEVREELDRWMGLVRALKVPLDRGEVKGLVQGIGGSVGRTRWKLLRPFKPVFDLTGTGQGWALFATADSYPQRLEIWIGDGDVERMVFQRLSSEHQHLGGPLSFRRVRGLYDSVSGKPKPTYRRFVRWIAEQTFEAHPEADWVRVQQVRTHTVLPWEPPDDMAAARFAITRTRKAR